MIGLKNLPSTLAEIELFRWFPTLSISQLNRLRFRFHPRFYFLKPFLQPLFMCTYTSVIITSFEAYIMHLIKAYESTPSERLGAL